MTHWPLLSLLIWLPILGGVFSLMAGNKRPDLARWIALGFALLTFVVSLPLLTDFQMGSAAMQFVEQRAWIPAYDIQYHLGVDGLSVPLIVLTTLVGALVLVGAWGSVNKRVAQYYASLMILEGAMIGVFCALDSMLFYVFFEAMLIPMFIVIGVWGGPRRIYASMKFFLYTFIGSVFMLIGLIYLYLKGGSWQIADMAALPLSMTEQTWLFWGFFAAFAIKVPMFPVHTWLPDAHVEA
ncbi:MAG TPA: NADH-quinone oxidoreductase subunit M, partial [Thermomonas sp.]|nr:NADH-quinone oxidoreductase subunit M [Thermomonas sp.]